MSKIGTAIGTLVDLADLATPLVEPEIVPNPYQESVRLGSGGKKGKGFPSQTWRWGALNNDERAMLRTLCANESADIAIETIDPEDYASTVQYTGKVHWPDEEDPQVLKTIGFILLFTNLVEVP